MTTKDFVAPLKNLIIENGSKNGCFKITRYIPTKILKIDHEILVSKGVKRKLNIVNDKSVAG